MTSRASDFPTARPRRAHSVKNDECAGTGIAGKCARDDTRGEKRKAHTPQETAPTTRARAHQASDEYDEALRSALASSRSLRESAVKCTELLATIHEQLHELQQILDRAESIHL